MNKIASVDTVVISWRKELLFHYRKTVGSNTFSLNSQLGWMNRTYQLTYHVRSGQTHLESQLITLH